MAIDLSSLATIEEYRNKTGDFGTGDGSGLLDELEAQTRQLEHELHVASGQFVSHTETYVLWGSGEERLWLRDSNGMAYFLRTVPSDAIGIDTDEDGTYDGYTWDLGDAWVEGRPENAIVQAGAFSSLLILPGRSSSLAVWPKVGIQFAACTWGLPSTSTLLPLLRDVVIYRTHLLRENIKGGATQELPSFDGALPLQNRVSWLMKRIEDHIGRRIPVF